MLCEGDGRNLIFVPIKASSLIDIQVLDQHVLLLEKTPNLEELFCFNKTLKSNLLQASQQNSSAVKGFA